MRCGGICCQTSEAAPECAPLGRVLDSRFCLRVIVADSIISRCGQRVNVKQIATADEARGEGRNLLTFTRPRGPRTRSIPQGILRGSLLLMSHVFACCDLGSMLNAARRRRVAAAAAAPAAVADSLTGILFMLPHPRASRPPPPAGAGRRRPARSCAPENHCAGLGERSAHRRSSS